MIRVLAILLALNFGALASWVVLLVHVARRVGALENEQKATRADLSLHAYALAAQLAADHEERRKHLNLVQGMLVGHVRGPRPGRHRARRAAARGVRSKAHLLPARSPHASLRPLTR